MEQSVLIYGDSNTWGWDTKTSLETGDNMARFDRNTRFCGILQKKLPEIQIVEEGLPGRTTVLADPLGEYKSGKYYLLPCLLSHAPLALVVLILGTNDRQLCYRFPPIYSAAGIEELVRVIRGAGCGAGGLPPEVLIVSPPAFGPGLERSPYSGLFPADTADALREMDAQYRQKAHELDCHFLSAYPGVKGGPADCIHLDEENHAALAELLEHEIRSILRFPG